MNKPLNFDSPKGKTIRDLTDEERDRFDEEWRDYQDMMAEMPKDEPEEYEDD